MGNKIKEIEKVTLFCSVAEGELKKAEAWLFHSLSKQRGVKSIDLYLVNYTGKGTMYNGPEKVGKLSVREINPKKQVGFGEAHNFAFETVKPKDFFIIINPDVYMHENCISELVNKIKEENDYAIVEGRQLPFEHPKEYDEKTLETPWASGFCMTVRSEFFKKVGGFDDNFWMYCEDVDLSWRCWLEGYKVIYNPRAIAYHYTGNYFSYTPTRYFLEHFWSTRNFIYIVYKYWGEEGESRAKKMLKKQPFPDYFKQEVLRSFDELKKTKPRVFKGGPAKYKDKIKVLGFNQYHEMRK